MKFTRRRFGIAASAMLATGVTPALAQDRPKIRVGVLRLASSGNVFIAADRNYFKDAGTRRRAEIFRRRAADSGRRRLRRCRCRRHRVHGLAVQSRRQGRGVDRRRAEPRCAGISADGISRDITPRGRELPIDEGYRREKRRHYADRLELSLQRRTYCGEIQVPAGERKIRTAAIDVECRVCAEGRSRRSGDPAGDGSAAAARCG